MPHQLLLADDSVTIQRVIKLTFADEDIDVVAVGDGDQAVEAIDSQPPDIVLVDIAMPGRSGYEVAQHVRTSPRLAHIPVVLLTGAFEPVDEARASEIGCDGVFAKPFEPEAVVSCVRELLAKPRVAPQEPAAKAPAASSPAPVQAMPVTPLPAPAPAQAVSLKAPAPTATPRAAVVSAPAAPPPATPDVDAYFERLDQAFATFSVPPSVPAPAQPDPAAAAAATARAGAAAASPFTPAAPTDSVSSMTLEEAFATLAASPRRSDPAAPIAVAPGPSPVSPDRAPLSKTVGLSAAELEYVVNQVLKRLTSRLGNPAEIVANVAERVVREEIAQIKSRM